MNQLDTAINGFVTTEEYQQIYLKWYAVQPGFWTVQILSYLSGGLFIIIIVGLLLWKYSSVCKNIKIKAKNEKLLKEAKGKLKTEVEGKTKELKTRVKELEQTKKEEGNIRKQLQSKVAELEKFNRLTIDRELKMRQMKKQIKKEIKK